MNFSESHDAAMKVKVELPEFSIVKTEIDYELRYEIPVPWLAQSYVCIVFTSGIAKTYYRDEELKFNQLLAITEFHADSTSSIYNLVHEVDCVVEAPHVYTYPLGYLQVEYIIKRMQLVQKEHIADALRYAFAYIQRSMNVTDSMTQNVAIIAMSGISALTTIAEKNGYTREDVKRLIRSIDAARELTR